jgi:hypothetical protein
VVAPSVAMHIIATLPVSGGRQDCQSENGSSSSGQLDWLLGASLGISGSSRWSPMCPGRAQALLGNSTVKGVPPLGVHPTISGQACFVMPDQHVAEACPREDVEPVIPALRNFYKGHDESMHWACLHVADNLPLAEGDKVVARWTNHGTHQGEGRDIAATGKHVTRRH